MLLIVQSILIGLFSTVFMDVITWILEKLFKIKPLNYALIGRWFLYWKEKKFTHKTIVHSSPRLGESKWGWGIHYLTGIIWVIFYLILNEVYLFNSSFISILIFSLCTTLVPFIIIQPALGFGFFAKKTPNQLISIRNSLLAHIAFGSGIYLSLNLSVSYLP